MKTWPDRDTGLAGMLAATQPGDHGVLADWVQEHLELDDLAAALRVAGGDSRDEADRAGTSYHDFRYRLLDALVMLYLARYMIWRFVGGRPQSVEGRVLGLYLSPGAPHGPARRVYWYAEDGGDAVGRLWEAMKEGPAQ
jgi:hypothetical protein